MACQSFCSGNCGLWVLSFTAICIIESVYRTYHDSLVQDTALSKVDEKKVTDLQYGGRFRCRHALMWVAHNWLADQARALCEQMLKEIDILWGMRHPNIVQFIMVGKTNSPRGQTHPHTLAQHVCCR